MVTVVGRDPCRVAQALDHVAAVTPPPRAREGRALQTAVQPFRLRVVMVPDPLSFGDFVLDPDQGRLWRSGVEVPLQPTVARTLCVLATHADQLLDREALIERVWQGTVVSNDAVHQMIRQVRLAIGDVERPYRFVQTVPRRGYRFNGAAIRGDFSPSSPSLPAERDLFIGREAEMARIDAALHAGVRVLTLHGFGGIGKTRVAQRVARALESQIEGGVAWCELVEARGPEGLLACIARGLGLHLGSDDLDTKILRAFRCRGPTLVVLDNAEQVAEPLRAAIGRWLEGTPDVSFLITSRVVIGARGEQVLRIEPMGPDEGVALLRARAGTQNINTDLARDLVVALDGLPLAIELAAARLRALPIDEVLGRLRQRFLLLRAETDHPERHRALDATLAWSLDLVSTAERHALYQLSCFEGTFTVNAAEAVVDVPDLWVPDVLQTLVDSSLVQRHDSRRLRLLATVRAYAREMAEPGLLSAADRRHEVWCAGLGERGAALMPGDVHVELVAALRRTLSRGDVDLSLGVVESLFGALIGIGSLALVDRLVTQLDELAGPTEEQSVRIAVHVGWLHLLNDRTSQGRARLHDALDRAEALGDVRTAARAHEALAKVYRDCSEDSAARYHAERAVDGYRNLTDRWREARALLESSPAYRTGRTEEALDRLAQASLAAVACGNVAVQALAMESRAIWLAQRGDLRDALGLQRQAIALLREQGNRFHLPAALNNLSRIALKCGQVAEARQASLEGLSLARRAGRRRLLGSTLSMFGTLALRQGQLEDAEAHLRRALALYREVKSRQSETLAMANLGIVLLMQGQSASARPLLEESARRHREAGHVQGLAYSTMYVAWLDAQDGELDRALATAQRAVQAADGHGHVQVTPLAHLADVYLALGETELARQAVDQARALEPTGLTRRLIEAVAARCSAARGELLEARRWLARARSDGVVPRTMLDRWVSSAVVAIGEAASARAVAHRSTLD